MKRAIEPNEAHCDPRRVELFLSEQLDRDEEAAFERHLDECTSCRGLLEASAADAEIWRETREHLSDCALQVGGEQTLEIESVDSTAPLDGPTAASLGFLRPTDDPRMLGRFGGYEIAGVVGQGGMGIVLKGFDSALNRYVAIKVLAPHLATNAAARQRFAREAQAAAAVVHENVIAIHGVADDGGLPYLVMPYVRGVSLERRLGERGPLGVAEILRVGMQTASGLAAAHAQGLVHRDIKPANILLAEGVERVTLTDFGLARAADDASLTQSGVIAGTPLYMSPEQARGETVDQRSDVFSFGSVLYAMCTGRPPFRAETSFGVLRRITDSTPRPIRADRPEIPRWLEGLTFALLAKEPPARFASAAHLARLLEEALAHVHDPLNETLPEELAAFERDVPAAAGSAEATGARGRARVWLLGAAVATLCVAVAGGFFLASRLGWTSFSGEATDVAPREEWTGAPLAVGLEKPREDVDAASDLPSQTSSEAPVTHVTPPPSWSDGTGEALRAIELELQRLEAALETPWSPRLLPSVPSPDPP